MLANDRSRDAVIGPLPIAPDMTEEEMVTLWLHGKSAHTIQAYRQEIAVFRTAIDKPLRFVYLGDLQRYAVSLTGAAATRARKLLTIKSFLSFAARLGYTPFNVGAVIRPPLPDNRLAERILHARQVFTRRRCRSSA